MNTFDDGESRRRFLLAERNAIRWIDNKSNWDRWEVEVQWAERKAHVKTWLSNVRVFLVTLCRVMTGRKHAV